MPQDNPSVGRYFLSTVRKTLSLQRIFISRVVGYIPAFILLLTVVLSGVISGFGQQQTVYAQTPNTTLNFQARILNLNGSLVADGDYNLEFKIYDTVNTGGTAQGACSGNCLWMETRTGGNVVRVVNGYVSVNLGSVTSFPSNMPWGNNLYITMRVGGTGAPSWDAQEMTNSGNRMKMSVAPVAFVANNVASGSTNSASTNSSTISIQSGNALGTTSNSGNITIDSGTATGTAGAITLGATNASALTLGRSGLTTTNSGALTVSQALTAGSTLTLTTLGSTDTATFICRNSSNILAGCSYTPLSSAITDNIVDAFDLQEGANNYININTTNGSENISFGNASTNPSYSFLGTGTLAVTGSQTVGGNIDVAGTIFAGTGDAFQVSSAGAVTAVGINAGAGLLQGSLGLTVTGADINLNVSSNNNTNINTGTSNGTVAIGNSLSTTNVLGATNINTTGTNTTTVGSATSALNVNGTTTLAAGFSQTGANTFSTGTGAISLNGATSVTGTNTLTVGTGVTTLGGNLVVDTSTLYVNATSDFVNVGSASDEAARFAVIGANNETQLLVRASASQTVANPLVLLQNSSSAELARINATTTSLYFGNAAGGNSAAGANNTGIGVSALGSVLTGTGNTTLGSGALASVSVGDNNVALGYQAANLTTGSNNTALGTSALLNNTGGSANVAVGLNALYNNSTSDSTAVGTQALEQNTIGYGNVAVGKSAGQNNQTGGGNALFGYYAGAGVASNSYSNNSIFGTNAGLATTTGSNNILFGYQAGDNITTGSNNIIIGYDLNASAAGVDNELRIGGVLQGNTSTLAAQFNGALTVTGLTTLNGGLTLETGDTFTFNGDGFTDFTGGGLVNTGGVLTVDTTSATGYFQNGGNAFTAAATLGVNANYALNLETNSLTRMTIQADGDIDFNYLTATTSTLFVDAQNDRVGVGTSVPAQKLEVQSTAEARVRIDSSGANETVGIELYNADGTTFRGGFIYNETTGNTDFYGPNGTEAISIDSSRNVLFGASATLTGDLAVNGDDITSDGDLTVTPAGGDTNIVGRLAVSGSTGGAYGTLASFVSTTTSVGADAVGTYTELTVSPGSASTDGYYGSKIVATSASSNLTSNADLTGLNASGQYTGTGTIDQLGGAWLYGENTSTGTVNRGYGLYVDAPYNTGAGTIINSQGIVISNTTSATNNSNLVIGSSLAAGNWSIYNDSAYNNYFAGNLGIGQATAATIDGSTLVVNNQANADNILLLQDNGVAVLTVADGGALTATQLVTLNGGLTVETGDTLTFNGDAFTDFTGGGLVNTAGVLTVDTTTAAGFFQNGGNSFAATATLGTNDANILSLETTNTSRFQIAAASSTLTGQGATTLSSTSTLAISSAAASNIDVTTGTTGALTLDSGTTGTVNLGTNANAKTVNVGSSTGASILNLIAGTGTAAGDLNILTTAGGIINISNNAVTNKVLNLGSAGSTNAASTVNIANTNANATQAVNIGATNSANNVVLIQGGTSATAIRLAAGAAGTITVGSQTVANTVSVGTVGSAAFSSTVNIGTSTGALQAVTIGSNANFASTLALQGGNGATAITLTPQTTGQIVIGAAAGTGNITLGSSSATQSVLLGNGAGASTVNIANATVAGATVNIAGGANTSASTVSIANGATAAATTVNILSGVGTASTASLLMANNTRVTTIDIGNIAAAAARTINVGTGNNAVGADTINIGTGTPSATGTKVITIGSSANVASTTSILGGNGTAAIALTPQTTGTIVVGAAAGTGNITIGSSSGSQSVLIGNGAGTATVNIGNASTSAVVSIGAAMTTGTISIGGTGAQTGTISLGTGTGVQTINLGTGAAAKTINLGTTTAGSSLSLNSDNAISVNSQALTFSTGGARAITLAQAPGSTNGYNLSITAGGGGSGGTATTGGILTLQGGTAGQANANGGNVNILGGVGAGAGVKGLVVIDTVAYDTAATQNSADSVSGSTTVITAANINSYGAIRLNATGTSQIFTMADPTTTTAGRVIYVTNIGANDFTLSVNGGGTGNTITLKPNTTATMYWNGADWTAAGASSSTDLQAAYNNTATSAGGAEIVLSSTGTGGLTIRNDSTASPITGGLLEVQTSIGSNLFTVNNNATEYSTNGGAETAGGSPTTFAANTWDTTTGGTVSRYVTTGDNIATGAASVSVVTTTTNHGARNRINASLTSGLTYTVSYAVRGLTNFATLQTLYSPDGTTTGTTQCSTAQTVTSGIWTRVSCTFVASGTITSSNSILIRQTDATGRTFYIDNLSVNVNASVSYAGDGAADVATSWGDFEAGAAVAVSLENSVIYEGSGSIKAIITPATANVGIRNNMAIAPAINTQYLVSFYARSTTTMTSSMAVGFLPAGGNSVPSGTAACVDYSTQSLVANTWTKITCLFTTTATAISNADLVIYQTDSAARTIYVDDLSITLNTNNSNNVQIGGGNKGGPVTLFTLDRSNGAPIADNNDAYLGSMYYDTSSGRIQCYEADGWGACGAAPDNIVNLNPEYAGAVLNGTGVGTMTADFCSNDTALTINSTLCSTGQAKNYYKWTSPQATSQTYSIYVTYQLPATFNGFSSDDTVQLTARVDDTTNASVTYEMFKSTGSAVTQCGSGETNVITGGGGAANTWYSYGISGNESTGCSFNSSSAGNFVIFKINMKANSNKTAYVSTLSFVTTGR